MPVFYDPVESGIEGVDVIKPFALTSDTQGVDLANLLELVGSPSASTTPAITTIADATTATACGDRVDLHYDMVAIEWQRGTGNNFQFREYFLQPVYYYLDEITSFRADGDTLAVGPAAEVWTNQNTLRTLAIGRTAGGDLLFQENPDALSNYTTLENGDTIRIQYQTYVDGLIGGRFRKEREAEEPLLVIQRTNTTGATPSAPTGITYHGGGFPSINASSPWRDAKTTLSPLAGESIYWAFADTTYNYGTKTWTVGTWTVLASPANRIQFSRDGITWVASPPDNLRYVRVRKTVDSQWTTAVISEAGKGWHPLASIVYAPESGSTNIGTVQRRVALSETIDFDDWHLLLFTWVWDNRVSNIGASILVPTARLISSTGTDYTRHGNRTLELRFDRNGIQGWAPGWTANLGATGSDIQAIRVNFERDAADTRNRICRALNLFQPGVFGEDGDGRFSVYGLRV